MMTHSPCNQEITDAEGQVSRTRKRKLVCHRLRQKIYPVLTNITLHVSNDLLEEDCCWSICYKTKKAFNIHFHNVFWKYECSNLFRHVKIVITVCYFIKLVWNEISFFFTFFIIIRTWISLCSCMELTLNLILILWFFFIF